MHSLYSVMAPSVSYIKIHPDCAIQARVFINRKSIILSCDVAINEKSIIKLSLINSLRLSSLDLTNLIHDLKDDLKELLLRTPLRELLPKKSVTRTTRVVKDFSNQWKCRVSVTLGYLADLRFKLGYLKGDDVVFLEEKGIALSTTDSKKTALLSRLFKFNTVFNEEEFTDDKKSLGYTLQRIKLFNNRVTDCLDVYVTHRPRI